MLACIYMHGPVCIVGGKNVCPLTINLGLPARIPGVGQHQPTGASGLHSYIYGVGVITCRAYRFSDGFAFFGGARLLALHSCARLQNHSMAWLNVESPKGEYQAFRIGFDGRLMHQECTWQGVAIPVDLHSLIREDLGPLCLARVRAQSW